jgi:hypothetical protein
MAITTGILTGGSNNHQTTSEEANAWATDFISEGIVGAVGSTNGIAPTTGSFSINAQGTPDMTVAVGSGTAYVTGTPSSQASQTFRVKNSASSNVTISANSSGSTKYDWVYISLDATKLNTPNTAADDVATLVTSRSSSASSDDGTPPTYGFPLAVVTVANGAVSITNSNVRDLRTQSTISSSTSGTSNDWYSLALSPNTVTALGNRSYSLVFNSTDLTSYISNGMRLKLPRTVTPPTQCADLEASSSQYYSKTSPTGLSFTDDFTCMGWIKLESYTRGGIIARRNGDTEGWSMAINASGQILFEGLRIAANNVSAVSYQSVPLNKWVHVAGSMDMSGTSTLLYIDGVLVPSATTVTGTATALVQGTTALVVGAEKSAGTNPFDGKIVQAAVYSTVLSAATIRAAMNQTLTGSETSLVSAYTFNNSINDLSANANNLTAQGSAVATNADSPMNATEYGIVMANSFSTNTTLTVQVPEGYSLPTTGGIGTVSYSTQKTPYGFPGARDKWRIESLYNTQTSAASSATTTYNTMGAAITVPVGTYSLSYRGNLYVNRAAATFGQIISLISATAANNTPVSRKLAAHMYMNASGAGQVDLIGQNWAEDIYTATTATTLYVNLWSELALAALGWYSNSSYVNNNSLVITLENAYL